MCDDDSRTIYTINWNHIIQCNIERHHITHRLIYCRLHSARMSTTAMCFSIFQRDRTQHSMVYCNATYCHVIVHVCGHPPDFRRGCEHARFVRIFKRSCFAHVRHKPSNDGASASILLGTAQTNQYLFGPTHGCCWARRNRACNYSAKPSILVGPAQSDHYSLDQEFILLRGARRNL